MTVEDVVARMGELVTSRAPHEVLVAKGLGSCIGLALIDRRLPIAGLAHVMLPDAPAGDTATPAKFADRAVPALCERMAELGANPWRLDAVVVGGAQMFSFERGEGSRLDVGARNEDAVRGALEDARIPVRAAATGGTSGRTMRVAVRDGIVVVKEAGHSATELFCR